jgi:casein kinase II subunit alpha
MEFVHNTDWKALYPRMTDSDIKHYTFQLLSVCPVSSSVTPADMIFQALEFSHQHGVMHRDVKPGNIVIDVRTRKV